ncbi:MAG: hypothetical protein ACYTFY_12285 [Planctomycetota bacterium]|jgi:hypothetical protein
MDIYTQIIREFNKGKVNYIVIGVSGINYYAKNAMHIIMTGDYDIFIDPKVKNAVKALRVMKKLDFIITTKDGEIKKVCSENIEKIVSSFSTFVCENHSGNLIELCLAISGFTFDELLENSNKFKSGRTGIRVASLKDLLRSKEIADRPKDRLFLEKYKLILEEDS